MVADRAAPEALPRGTAVMLSIRHVTTYRYARPVRLGPHRLMFRPRDSHDLRLYSTRLSVSPPAASLRWLHDVFGNSIAIAEFTDDAAELRFESDILLEHYALEHPEFAIEDYARTYPFSYSAEDIPDLGRTIERHYPDPEHRLDAWAKRFALPPAGTPEITLVDTQEMLERMMRAIREDFAYVAREEEGTREPAETLRLGNGSCRDFALLMIEAARTLGFAARFVSGYLYEPGGEGAAVGGGATHAWVQIYLPGAGWVEFDPTNGIVGGRNLIRVAVARTPQQAIPLSGEWTGAPADFLGMEVTVKVSAGAAALPHSPP